MVPMKVRKVFLYLSLIFYLKSGRDLSVSQLKRGFKEFSVSNLYALLRKWENEGFIIKRYLEDMPAGSTRTVYNLSESGIQMLEDLRSKLTSSVESTYKSVEYSDIDKKKLINDFLSNISEELNQIIVEILINKPTFDAKSASEVYLKRIQALLINELKDTF